MRKLIVVFASLILIAFCALSIEIKSEAENYILMDSKSVDDTLGIDSLASHLVIGRGYFNKNCNYCHATSISHYMNEQGWDSITQIMGISAGLNESQIIDLNSYVIWQLERTDSSNMTPVIGAYRQW